MDTCLCVRIRVCLFAHTFPLVQPNQKLLKVNDVHEKLDIESEKSAVDEPDIVPLPEPPAEVEMENAVKKKTHFMSMAEVWW